MWAIITSENKDVCQQTLNALEPMEGNNLIIVNGGADDYAGENGLLVPKGWDAIRLTEVKGVCEIMQLLFNLFPDEKHYGLIPENCIIEAVGWEEKMKGLCRNRNLVCSNDGNQEPFPFTGVRLWPGDLVRRVGWWGVPGLHTTGMEWAWIKIAWDMVCWDRAMGVNVSYLPRNVSAIDKAIEANAAKDKEAFELWREKEYYKIFRRLFFDNEKWRGKTNFPQEKDNGQQDKQITASA